MKEQRDQILVSRVVDGDATATEWDELKTLADADPAIWHRLADTLRDHTVFARAVNESVAVAETIEPPVVTHAGKDHGAAIAAKPLGRIGPWSGWAVAAVVTFAGLMAYFQQHTSLNDQTATDLLQAYLDRGRQEDLVIGEVPDKVLLETRPWAEGEGYELLYLRQILERTVVPELYQPAARDELGRPTLIRYEPRQGPPM